MRRLLTIVASAAVAATAVLATGGLSNAGAAPDTGTSSSADAGAGASACGGRGGLLGRVVHGDLIVGGQQRGYRPVTIDRGTVTAIDASSITLNRPDDESVTAKLTDATRFRGKSRDQVRVGDQVMVVQANGSARAVVSKPEGSTGCRGGNAGAARRGGVRPTRATESGGTN
jgi:hypothetical protein